MRIGTTVIHTNENTAPAVFCIVGCGFRVNGQGSPRSWQGLFREVGRVPTAVRAVFAEQFTICHTGENLTVAAVRASNTSKYFATIRDATVVQPNLSQTSLDRAGPTTNPEHHPDRVCGTPLPTMRT